MKYAARLLLVAVLIAAGCGPSPAPTPSPAEVAGEAALKMQAVNSFHFVITVTGKSAFLDANKTMALKKHMSFSANVPSAKFV